MSQARVNIPKTKDIKNPTYYVEALNGEFANFAYDEVRALEYKGEWRQRSFSDSPDKSLDVEIGTGNGYFFAHHTLKNPDRLVVGVELKFKPLIQTIRRALNNGSKNARVIRFNASFLNQVFAVNEIDNVYIHHPDPWTKLRKHKHRLLNPSFLAMLYGLQKPNSFIDFKTDSADYFFWAADVFRKSSYEVIRYTENLHQSEWAAENFATHFENLFLKQGLPIYYLRAMKRPNQQ